jgi:hypothetical protein
MKEEKTSKTQITIHILIIVAVCAYWNYTYSKGDLEFILNSIGIICGYGSVLVSASKIYRTKREKIQLENLYELDLQIVKKRRFLEFTAMTNEEITEARKSFSAEQNKVYDKLEILEQSEKNNNSHILLSVWLVAIGAGCQLYALTI